MPKNTWSEEQKSILVENYSTHTVCELADMIGKAENNIRCKLLHMGLTAKAAKRRPNKVMRVESAIQLPKYKVLNMERGKKYKLTGVEINDNVIVLNIYSNYVLCLIKKRHGSYKECFLKVDLGNKIRYKEVS